MQETTAEAAEPTAFPQPRGCPFHEAEPPYQQLREEQPISRISLPAGGEAWLLTRHEDVRTMLTDPRFSADRRKPGFPLFAAGQTAFRRQSPSMITLDGAEHSGARRPAMSGVAVKCV